MIILKMIISIGTLAAQIITLKEMIQIMRELKETEEEQEERKHTDGNEREKNTHQEAPKWVEEFIDAYMNDSADKTTQEDGRR